MGIQGPLSHLFSEPVYVSSITISKYESVTAQKGDYIKKHFKSLQVKLGEKSESVYKLSISDVEIADVELRTLFSDCFRPCIKESYNKDMCLHLETIERVKTKKAAGITEGNLGPNFLVSTLKSGIGTDKFCEKMVSQLKDATKEFTKKQEVMKQLKKAQLDLLKEALLRLSKQ